MEKSLDAGEEGRTLRLGEVVGNDEVPIIPEGGELLWRKAEG